MHQLSLFPIEQIKIDQFTKESFVLSSQNLLAYNKLSDFCSSKNQASPLFNQFSYLILLIGEEYSGKTHLLRVLSCEFPQISFLTKESLLSPLHSLETNHTYILEDIEEIDEVDTFHLVNAAIEKNAFIIMSSKKEIKEFCLKDLVSRLGNIRVVRIEKPEEKTVMQILTSYFSARQLKVPHNLISYCAKNLKRSYKEILATAKWIEFYCLEQGKAPSKKEIGGFCYNTKSHS